jgi:hypothetical protein
MNIDYSDSKVCFTFFGTSPSNENQDLARELRQGILYLSHVQNFVQFWFIAFHRQVTAHLPAEHVKLFDQRWVNEWMNEWTSEWVSEWVSGDSLPISELKLKYVY